MRGHLPMSRRGITLMEVMISIGILAIGLTSVLSIIPAGKSEVTRAIVYDRASALAANALADAATFGLLKPESLTWSGSNQAVLDPAASAAWAGAAGLKSAGIYSGTNPAGLVGNEPAVVLKLLAQGRDDLVYNPPADDESLPTNQFPGTGPRSFLGRMSCVVAVTGTASLTPGGFATLSVVVFHNRDLSSGGTITTSGSLAATGELSGIVVPAGRTLRETVHPGVVLYHDGTRSFHQLAMAALISGSNAAYVTFATGTNPANSTVKILLDSVGLAERTVVLEGASAWSQ